MSAVGAVHPAAKEQLWGRTLSCLEGGRGPHPNKQRSWNWRSCVGDRSEISTQETRKHGHWGFHSLGCHRGLPSEGTPGASHYHLLRSQPQGSAPASPGTMGQCPSQPGNHGKPRPSSTQPCLACVPLHSHWPEPGPCHHALCG